MQNEPVEVTLKVTSVFEQLNVPYLIGGSLASTLYGVVKMATGSGKTKVMSLFITWCYFHKLYEEDSQLATNFLLIAPNIIMLDRLRTDFDGLKIFSQDPLLPDNGYEGQNWQDDFQMTLHIQDDVSIVRKTGNLFLTNYLGDYS